MINVEVGLILLSIDLKNGHYRLCVTESGEIPGHTQDVTQKQPYDTAVDIAFSITELSDKWLTCIIKDSYYSDDYENSLVVLYSSFVPAIISLPEQYKWIAIEDFQSTDERLNKAIQDSLIRAHT